ncbi:MAG: hypothetical protein ACODAU_10395 [Myxococcota bacterium]
MARLGRTAGLLVLVLAAGCVTPGDFDDFRASGTVEERDDFIDELAFRFCTVLLDCETKLGVANVLQVFCHPGIRDEFGVELLLRDNPMGPSDRTGFNGEHATQCLAALDELGRCQLPGQVLPEPCRQVFSGTQAPGEPCAADSECDGGWCDFVDDQCPQGTCVARLPMDEPCEADRECELNLICRSGSCQPPARQGAACDSEPDCGDLLWCNPGSGECEPLPNIGERCSTSFGVDPCRGALVCTEEVGGSVCREGGTEDDECGGFGVPPCAPGHRCVDGTCRPLVLPGETGCASAANCAVFHECDGTDCVPLPAEGDPCSPVMPCIEGACEEDGVCRRQPAGATCEPLAVSIGECEGWCDGGTCTDRLGEGEACSGVGPLRQCQDDLACIDPGGGHECTPCGSL